MKKKSLTTGLLLAVSVLLCACGATAPVSEEDPVSGNSIGDSSSADKIIVSEDDAVNLTENTNNKVINLTAENNTTSCIDYNIPEYTALQEFSYALFGENMNAENPVLSPVSAYLALTMAGMGAGGNTEAEFHKVLGEDMVVLADDMMNTLPAEAQDMTLSIANSAWINRQFAVNEDWIGRVKSFLDAEAFQTELSSNEAMNGINGWIAEKTNGLIPQMLEEPLGADTCLALFNTVYFKAKWRTPFEAYDTHMESFRLADGSIVEAEMMNQYEKELEYIANDFSEGIVLPYTDSNLSLVALKPTGEDNVRELCGRLTVEVMHGLLKNRETKTVNLKIPKFEIDFDRMLNEGLQRMGLVNAFEPGKANFDRIGQNDLDMYISIVRQKAKIIVDEDGTEAAAATEVSIKEMALEWPEEEPKNVYFDEPFLYIIMDMNKEIPLFIGIIDNPTA